MVWRHVVNPARSEISLNTIGPFLTKPPAVMGRRSESSTGANVPAVDEPLWGKDDPAVLGACACAKAARVDILSRRMTENTKPASEGVYGVVKVNDNTQRRLTIT